VFLSPTRNEIDKAHQREGKYNLALTILLVVAEIGSALVIVIVVGAVTGALRPIAAVVLYLLIAVVLICRAFPPDRRHWVLWIIGSALLGLLPLLWLSWLAVSKASWPAGERPTPERS